MVMVPKLQKRLLNIITISISNVPCSPTALAIDNAAETYEVIENA